MTKFEECLYLRYCKTMTISSSTFSCCSKKTFFDVSLAVSRPSFSNLFSQIVGGDVFDDGGAVNVDLTI